MTIEYAVQNSPDGIAQAFLIGNKFLADSPAALVLGDNLFHGHELIPQLRAAYALLRGPQSLHIRFATRSATAWSRSIPAAPP